MRKDKAGKDSALPSDITVILPSTPMPEKMLTSLQPPGPDGKIEQKGPPLAQIFKEMKRTWFNGLYIKNSDLSQLDKIKINMEEVITDPHFSDFTFQEHKMSASELSENTALCKVNDQIGWGLYVRAGKSLNKGFLIPISGELDFSLSGLRTNTRAVAFMDSEEIIALIDPTRSGGLYDFINHAFTAKELEHCIEFKAPDLAKEVATANIKSDTLIHNGVKTLMLQVTETIASGQQLLWSYLRPKMLLGETKKYQLFSKKTGKAISPDQYKFKKLQIVTEYDSHLIVLMTIEFWKIVNGYNSKEDEIVNVDELPGGRCTFVFSFSLIQQALIANPAAVLFILSSSKPEVATASIEKRIKLDQVEKTVCKHAAITYWLEIKLPQLKGPSWRTYILEKSHQSTALTRTLPEQKKNYMNLFRRLPKNSSERPIWVDFDGQLYTGFIIADWEALSELPYTPLPDCSVSSSSSSTTSSALSLLSITNSGVDPLKAWHCYGLSQRCLALDNLDAAENHLRKACQFNPTNKLYSDKLEEIMAEKSKVSTGLRS